MKDKITVFWFRRDLRIHDNHGFFKALETSRNVMPIFIFDTEILSKLENKEDRRVDFIVQTINRMNRQLSKYGKSIRVLKGSPLEVFSSLEAEYLLEAVYCNEDYEPSAIMRDQEVAAYLKSKSVGFYSYKDQVIFHRDDIIKADGTPYTVYTPYSKKWLLEYEVSPPVFYPSEKLLMNLIPDHQKEIRVEDVGFKQTGYRLQSPEWDAAVLKNYHETRNLPTQPTSGMSIHLRFGTVSIRKLATEARNLNETYLKELIWREFFMQILYHFPHVVTRSFKAKYDEIDWLYDETLLKKWQEGKTGYPLVDAGMRELLETGLMHNRVRMVCAGFFTKHLLMDWRIGETWFAMKLLDYDLAANNGNWQWSAGTGCDAAPYFRIFNPTEQQKKFDPEFRYIRKWVKEYGTADYPEPCVDHATARKRALDAYRKALNG